MSLDAISEERLKLVIPALSAKIHQMAEMLAQEGISFRVVQGFRSYAEQAGLYAQGRTAPGSIVTNAAAGYSHHNFGLAVDLVPMDPGPDWNLSHPQWQRMLAVGLSLGLTEGAQFRTFPDNPHFQLTGKWPASPDDEMRQVFEDAGLGAVWSEAGL